MGVCRERGVQLKPDQQDWQLRPWKTFFVTFVILCEYFFLHFGIHPCIANACLIVSLLTYFGVFLRNVAFKTQCFVLVVMYVQVCI